MKPSIRWLLILAIATILIIVLAQYFRTNPNNAAGPASLVGQRAPIFTLHDDRGATVSLAKYRGKIVLLNLWASWCPPCRAEMPDLARLQREFASRGLVVVGVNQGESAQTARTFARALGVTFPIWIDDQQQYGRIFAAFGLPTTIILNRNGRVVRGVDGALTLNEMRAAVAPLLAGKASSAS